MVVPLLLFLYFQDGFRVRRPTPPRVGGEVLDLGFLVCIDTDCSRGGWLTAFEARSGAILQRNQAGRLR
jgi:serine/threonine protein phosphatase 1